jgi:hypothetical protein
MIHAELRRKLGDEDRLTSTAFGLLRYIPVTHGFLPLFRCVRPMSPTAFPDLSGVARVEVEFWRYSASFGEPDMILRLLDANGRTRWVVLVEVKLHSPKSGRATEDADPAGDAPDPDQLVKYWQLLTTLDEVNAGATPHLVYLTKHAVPPADELAESLRRRPDMALGWLSWRDVWAVAKGADGLPAEDLARLLAHLGLKRFDGFTPRAWAAPKRPTFWQQCGWFRRLRPWTTPPVRTFWETPA